MKKIIRKLKGKKVLSFVLAAIMLATTFNMALPMLKLDASAAEPIDGVTQERIVGTDGSYAAKYENYAANFLNGASRPTNIVIPGLNATQDYVIQGMTYYPERDWMLVTAYHNAAEGETVQPSKVFALDAATGEFVAMFSFLNPDGTPNTEHGGGIACSENNIYYACGDDDREVAYAPISAFKDAPLGRHTVVQLVDMVEFNEIGSITKNSKTAYTAYVCYDDGVLWTGNFYDMGVRILGVPVAATDYSVPANNDYNSMVFGYRLVGNVGSTQEERSANEWNYLMGNVTGKDCRGNPSYVIGLNNSVKDVQYAVVDNGKLYLSCSFGTGEGTNSVSLGGMNPYSAFVVADIDLTQPGTKSTTINTHNGEKTVMAYDIQDVKNFNMMPMSEGLCVINDKIYITFESASNKYLNEAGALTGNCNYPIDVVWELDPFELMETVVAEPEKSIHYEKVYNHSQIKDGYEYIIVHESKTIDPVSQKPYLYALNAEGNFKGLEISKSTADVVRGYDGMIGYPISYYSFDTIKNEDGEDIDILYLDHPEDDDVAKIRWTITKNGDGDKYSIKNTSTYFANFNSLYFDSSNITMMPNNASQLSNILIGQFENDSGYFYLSNNGQYYLWCNDGFANYNAKANAYYANKVKDYPLLDGVTEVAGTFHCDALNASGTNILGGQINTSDDTVLYEDRAFQIYRRVVDEVASTYESRVYTNLDAELQADGTYNVTFDTYAISPNHYQYVGERPTDYIIVADTSKTMDITESRDPNAGSTGINYYDGSLKVDAMSISDDTAKGNGEGIIGYAFYNPDINIHFKHTDGKYYKAYMAINNMSMSDPYLQCFYVYYIADDGLYYCVVNHDFQTDSDGNRIGKTLSEFKAWIALGVADTSSADCCSDWDTSSSNSTRRDEDVYVGEHYRFDSVGNQYAHEHTSLEALKTTANDLVDKIVKQNGNNRIALVQYGADASTGFIKNDGNLSTDDYANAFWATGAADQLKAKINTLSASSETNSSSNKMMEYVSNIIAKSDAIYTSDTDKDKDRNVVVIIFSDGVPGTETDKKEGYIWDRYTVTSTTETDANNTANEIISKARTIKANGAFIYTVLLGNVSAGSFSKKTYMDAVSSKYPAATSMTSLGGQSVDGVNYALNIATCSIDNFVNFGSQASEEIALNNAVGLDNLNAGSYLREVLSDAFIFPENEDDYCIETQFVPGEYDEIGRFAFGTPYKTNEVTTDIDTKTKTITVTGYDYSTQYISKGNDDGKALRVVITGLLLNEGVDLTNREVSIKEKTGIYKNWDKMEADDKFKGTPRDNVNVNEYTYVLDYGLDLLDTDVNGTLCAVSNGLTKQDVDDYNKISENGLVKIQEGDQNLIYHTTPTNTTDSGYVLIQRDSGKYDWFEIKVVPASNVYFEETEFAKDAGTGTVAWEKTTGGTSATHRELPGKNDPVGYDAAYDNNNTYSNGTAFAASVDSTNKRSKTATVTFAGSGIDIVSVCGPTTGMQIINIKDASTGKSVAASIVDTYYADATFSQVPVFSWRGNYGTYIVETTAVYLSTAGALKKSGFKSSLVDTGLVMNTADDLNTPNVQAMLDAAGVEDIDAENLELVWFDDNSVLNGGTGVAPTKKGARAGETSSVTLNNYIDGFRIYNPLGSNHSTDYEASEQGSMYYNVIDSLADGALSPDGSLDGTVAFVTGELAEGETLSFANYESIGPKNELYLNANATNGVTFKTPFVDGVKVMVSLRAVNGATTVNINGTEFAIKSATEMYYDITDLLVAEDGKATVSITNSGSGILAVNNIKLTNTVSGASLMPLSAEDIEAVQHYATMEPVQATVENGVVTPVVEEEIPGENTNNDTDTETEEFSIFSFVEMLIAFIEKILSSSFGTGNIF